MIYPVTALTAAILGLWLVILSVRVIRYRGVTKVSLGDGGNEPLIRRMRAQANFSEYVPLALILLFLAELQGGPFWLLALLAGLLVVGRLLHGIAFSFTDHWVLGRVGGMLLTFGSIVLSALANIWLVVSH